MKQTRLHLGFASAAVMTILTIAASSVRAATVLSAFRGGVRPDAMLKDPQSIITLSSACYTSPSANDNQALPPNNPPDCVITKLRADGASEQAIAFAQWAPVPAAIEYYKHYRNATAVYAVMRWADGASGWALIGNSGEAVGMWQAIGPGHDAKFAAFVRTHPGAFLLMPADRSDVPAETMLANGDERLIMAFMVRTCRACATLGAARMGFDFDHAGRYRGSHMLSITPARHDSQ